MRAIRVKRHWKSALAALAVTGGLVAAGAGAAQATDNSPCQRPQVSRASHWVQYCPVTQANVPVYANPTHGNSANVVGHLVSGGSANWFVGDEYQSKYSLGTYYNHWWAYTEADNGQWGWVPEVYFKGGSNDEGDAGLYVCSSGVHTNVCS